MARPGDGAWLILCRSKSRSYGTKRMNRRSCQAALLATVAMISTPVLGEEQKVPLPSAERGLAIAQVSCAACHLIGSKQQSSAVAGVPSFQTIANRPQQTAARLLQALIRPHRPMPQLQLTRAEIDDLIAYFDALRKPTSGEPLLPKRAPTKPKPKYPAPS